ncbi:hypothetical protein PIB30_050037 [Stylosanthes scabra]|uniref:Uncharacterized protein n=1 Tax=Stylosanthes scabra TaxID=79078 RepID=A0ABU6YGC7_9FABA|nr:hypothetical protein [Stylosanthes scabra]
MARTKSNPLAKEKRKAHRPPLRASPRLAALRSRGKAPPGKARNFHAEDPSESLHQAKSQASEEHEVITLSSDSEHEKDGNLEVEAEGALPAAEEGAEETLPKNNFYDALWAMLDVESENETEEIPGQRDLDSILNNWGKIEPNMGPARNDQGPPPAAN